MKARTEAILLSAFVPVIGILCCGCEPIKFTVEPGDTSVLYGGSVPVRITPVGQPPPKTVGIKSRKPGSETWSEPVALSLTEGQYTYTFANVGEELEYVLDVNAEGAGPYRITVKLTREYKAGYSLAEKYRKAEVGGYRLVIELQSLLAPGREEFLRGFMDVYAGAGAGAEGKKHVEILRQAVAGDNFELALEQGARHANNQVTDAQVQMLIRRSIGVSKGIELGWKAGYIEGYKREMAKAATSAVQPAIQLENLYSQAQAMYDALRAGITF